MKNYNSLIIAGTGQNVGKTTLVCNIISENKAYNIIALKISPHFHKLAINDKIISQTPNYTIVEETKTDTNKDSSKMLKAGAKKVFYIQSTDEFLYIVFDEIKKIIPANSNIIIESGGARNIFKPTLFLMIMQSNNSQIKLKSLKLLKLADKVILFENNTHNIEHSTIKIIDNTWVIK